MRACQAALTYGGAYAFRGLRRKVLFIAGLSAGRNPKHTHNSHLKAKAAHLSSPSSTIDVCSFRERYHGLYKCFYPPFHPGSCKHICGGTMAWRCKTHIQESKANSQQSVPEAISDGSTLTSSKICSTSKVPSSTTTSLAGMSPGNLNGGAIITHDLLPSTIINHDALQANLAGRNVG
eukprot:1160601-Pelagomonas_calceolata.AAC.6